MFQARRAIVSLIIFSFSASLLAMRETAPLIIVDGKAEHSPDKGVRPPTREDLLREAKEKAMDLLQLGDKQDYLQVSTWRTSVTCEPIYRGSEECYRGEAKATASFIAKKDLNKEWHVATRTTEHWHRRNEHDSDRDAMAKAYQRALDEARFFCNSDVDVPAVRERRRTEAAVMEWQCMLSIYEGDFRCKK